MKPNEHQEILDSLQLLADTAEHFVHQVPQLKRLEQVQRAMLAAMTKAQLVLSLHQPPNQSRGSSQPTPETTPSKPSGPPKSAPPTLRLV